MAINLVREPDREDKQHQYEEMPNAYPSHVHMHESIVVIGSTSHQKPLMPVMLLLVRYHQFERMEKLRLFYLFFADAKANGGFITTAEQRKLFRILHRYNFRERDPDPTTIDYGEGGCSCTRCNKDKNSFR
jgi:hypothetical protein